uniref:Uncharacterized protein n=1 Tax=Magallana gigas TaxID=29159 RepID=K1QC24_MAGGI
MLQIQNQVFKTFPGFFPDYEKEHTAGVTFQQRMLTPPRHMIIPLSIRSIII